MEKRLTYRDYARLSRLSLEELARQCEAEAFRATGPGGQGVNTTDSAVRMRHVPTGIVVVSRESRSQFQNRQSCLRKIRAELRRLAIPPKTRHATKPTKASVRRRLEGKRHRSEVKKARRRPSIDD
jgi:ribosome-associated protein